MVTLCLSLLETEAQPDFSGLSTNNSPALSSQGSGPLYPIIGGQIGVSSEGIGPSPLLLVGVQSLSLVRLFSTPWTAARQATLSITNS